MLSLTVLKERSRAWLEHMSGGQASPPPVPAPAAYGARLVDGKVFTEGLELPIVRHCNLSCRACTHLSPIVPRQCTDPAEIARDLATLSRHYHVRCARVMGGEPLLHPRLIELLTVIRASGIADRIR